MFGSESSTISHEWGSTLTSNTNSEPTRVRTTVHSRFDEVFREFYRKSSSRILPIKLEYLSARLVRGLKKAMRNLKEGPQRVRLIRTSRQSENASRLWGQLRQLFSAVPYLEDIASPNSEPGRNSSYRSFNRRYCREFFGSFESEPIFEVFIDLAFLDSNCESFCERFGMKCCKDPFQSCCWGRWESVKYWLKYEFIKELKEEGRPNQQTREAEPVDIRQEYHEPSDHEIFSVIKDPNTDRQTQLDDSSISIINQLG